MTTVYEIWQNGKQVEVFDEGSPAGNVLQYATFYSQVGPVEVYRRWGKGKRFLYELAETGFHES